MSHSSSTFIDHAKNGFLAFHTAGWLRALTKLAFDEKLRMEMGQRLNYKYRKTATPEVQNENLISFLNGLFLTKKSTLGLEA
jgi:hypothetical protein